MDNRVEYIIEGVVQDVLSTIYNGGRSFFRGLFGPTQQRPQGVHFPQNPQRQQSSQMPQSQKSNSSVSDKSLSTQSGRAKVIYDHLKKSGLPDKSAVAVMVHLYRTTDGMTYPYNKITIDVGPGGGQLGGGLRGYIYSSSVNMAKKYGLGQDVINKLKEMDDYAKECVRKGIKPLTKEAERAMNTRFPEGYPIPIEVQLQNITDTVQRKFPEFKNGDLSGKEMSQMFRKANNPGLKRPDGRWDHHSADVYRDLGLSPKS